MWSLFRRRLPTGMSVLPKLGSASKPSVERSIAQAKIVHSSSTFQHGQEPLQERAPKMPGVRISKALPPLPFTPLGPRIRPPGSTDRLSTVPNFSLPARPGPHPPQQIFQYLIPDKPKTLRLTIQYWAKGDRSKGSQIQNLAFLLRDKDTNKRKVQIHDYDRRLYQFDDAASNEADKGLKIVRGNARSPPCLDHTVKATLKMAGGRWHVELADLQRTKTQSRPMADYILGEVRKLQESAERPHRI